MSKGDESPAAGELDLFGVCVWVAFAVAAAATLFVLLKEPEDGAPQLWDAALVRYRLAALVASAAAGLAGVVRVLWRGAGPGLFGMAVLFNVVIACFWALRFLLAP